MNEQVKNAIRAANAAENAKRVEHWNKWVAGGMTDIRRWTASIADFQRQIDDTKKALAENKGPDLVDLDFGIVE